jgi:hypothetical protein
MKQWRLMAWVAWLSFLLPLRAYSAVPQLQVLDDFVIPGSTANGLRISELSGLAWDQDEQLLYAVSDRGEIFHFRLQLDGKRIQSVEPVFAARLLDSRGRELHPYRRDAEGLLALNANNGKHGDTQLVISLEGEPRLVRFTPQGLALKNIPVPAPLRDIHSLRSGNRGLESVAIHLRYGFITVPELPLKGQPDNLHTLYSTSGRQWSFMAYPADKSGISALETLPDGNMLILERAWSGFPNPLVVSLRYLDFARCSRDGACQADNLAVFSSLLLVDNFEGLTALGDGRYLMVSDDGGGDFQRTVLRLFTIR